MPASKRNKRFKRPQGWRHISGYGKYIRPTAKCGGNCNQKCTTDNPFRKCRKCAFHICWNCEQKAGGPSHKSVECSITDAVLTDCSDTTDSEDGDAKNPVDRWADEPREPRANHPNRVSHGVAGKRTHGRTPKSNSVVTRDAVESDDEYGNYIGMKGSRTKGEFASGQYDYSQTSRPTTMIKSTPQQLQHYILNSRSDESARSSTSGPSVAHSGPGAHVGLTGTEKELYMSRKPLLEKLDLWVQPDYNPPGMVPGVTQRRLLNASPSELEEFANIKQDCFFHALGRLAPMRYRSFYDTPAHQVRPQVSNQYWPVRFSHSLAAKGDIGTAIQPELAPRLFERHLEQVEVPPPVYSDTEVDEDIFTRRQGHFSSHRPTSRTPQGLHLDGGPRKRHKVTEHKQNSPGKVIRSNVERHSAHGVQLITPISSSAIGGFRDEDEDEDEDDVETDQPRAFGRGRGWLHVTTRTSATERKIKRKCLETHQPKPQRRTSCILAESQHDSYFLDDMRVPEDLPCSASEHSVEDFGSPFSPPTAGALKRTPLLE